MRTSIDKLKSIFSTKRDSYTIISSIIILFAGVLFAKDLDTVKKLE